MSTAFRPTHRIVLTYPKPPHRSVDVRLVDGAAYTREEWAAEASADWECSNGEWTFQGETAPRGVESVEVSEYTEEELALWDRRETDLLAAAEEHSDKSREAYTTH